jgi:type IV pilus assembly protein PilW
MNFSETRNRPDRRATIGFTLVELMVSLALGMLIVSGMLALIARNSETRGEIEKAGRQIENGRYAIQRLTEDIHHAGYYGEFYDFPTGTVLPANVCDVTLAGLKTAMSFPIQAFTAAATPPSCINAADFVAGTNVLVVRFVSPATTLAEGWVTGDLATNLAPGVVYMQPYVDGANFATRATAATDFITNKISGPGGVAVSAPIYRYITRIYFISPCSRPVGANCSSAADDGAPIPTLKMVELGSNGTAGSPPAFTNGTAPAFSATPISVAEGIERLEYDYGIDSDGDGAPDAPYKSCAPCTATEWSTQVVSVRINLLARNAERSNGYSDAKTYDMGLSGAASAPGGALNYKRHVFQVVVRLNNQSMRREQ